MGALEALTSGLVDQARSFIDPVVKLNKRQALTQGVNLGMATYCTSLIRLMSKYVQLRTEGWTLLLLRSHHYFRSDDLENIDFIDR